MPLVNAADLLEHARNAGYRVVAFEIISLDHIVPVIEAAERNAAPVILEFSAPRCSLAPALAAALTAARAATVPLVLEVRASAEVEAVTGAIRAGANSILLCPEAGSTQEAVEAAVAVARASGVPWFVSSDTESSAGYRHRRRSSRVLEAARGEIDGDNGECAGSGRAAAALAACRPWREIEHLIVYNVRDGCGTRFVEQMMAHGRAVLGAIPGVRQVLTGCALRDDARYRYCWLVRFSGPEVVATYRDHPDHVAFADNTFRPLAGDRLSIDFVLSEHAAVKDPRD